MNTTTETITPNVPRLMELARWLTMQERKRREGLPNEWDQSLWIKAHDDRSVKIVEKDDQVVIEGWSCGTAACAAGHIALQDGGMPTFFWGGGQQPVPPPLSAHDWYSDIWDAVNDTISDSSMFFPGGDEPESIDVHAARSLGLTQSQANTLFDGTNSWNTMIELIALFADIPEAELRTHVGADDLPYDEDDEDDEDDGCDCDGCTPTYTRY